MQSPEVQSYCRNLATASIQAEMAGMNRGGDSDDVARKRNAKREQRENSAAKRAKQRR